MRRVASGMLFLAGVSVLCLVAGCVSSSDTKVTNRASVGAELQDLEDARSKGLLTEDEYAKQREQIMKRK
jgi:outer membrane murein-binding lipoprotein Lpp